MSYQNPVRHITVDAHDAYAQAVFWSQLTGYALEDGARPGAETVAIESPEPAVPGLLFIEVPEGKTVKNRVHLDIRPTTGTRDAEVERLVGLGARVVDDRRTGEGKGWVVLTDPEGNEFCVERGVSELGPDES
ncbi:VOC family protein [Streptomyces sp. SAJ15]|uniref:VOC family protein n=1 Tax=Streptomyces sp. SAJ15 TaxID=2011095 RepID=UPI001185E7EF|nr:VOC family protein [Streptomyces sp. SAJ15]TVL87846.1 glyoxalase [Streptomyces sp. SAJ15]